MYEPTYGEGDKAQEAESTGTENDTSGSDVLEVGKFHHRIGSTEWCTCGNCIVMTSDVESVCCHEHVSPVQKDYTLSFWMKKF